MILKLSLYTHSDLIKPKKKLILLHPYLRQLFQEASREKCFVHHLLNGVPIITKKCMKRLYEFSINK